MHRWKQLTDRIDSSMEKERERNDARAKSWAARIGELEHEIEQTRFELRECERREVKNSARFDRLEAVLTALLAILESRDIDVPSRLMQLAREHGDMEDSPFD
jgi:septal ring factor EnvC (AmiA/AmiB activator)